jgi:eight-cysteine-cluster-containing protein
MRIALLPTALLLLVTSCSCPPAKEGDTTPSTGGAQPTRPAPTPPPAGGDAEQRTPAVESSHGQYQRVEGTSFQNACTSDDQCAVGGCSQEICSAEQGVSSTCEAPADGWPSTGASCGCVKGQCIWYRAAGTGPAAGGETQHSGGGGEGDQSAK